ncbi:MAG: DUF4240 domain-containing protein, partial [Flavobacterium sp.]
MRNSTPLLSLLLFFSITVFGQINEQNQEGILDNNENPEIIRMPNLDSISLSKSCEMLNEEVYWAIIDSSLHETTNQE